jgi:hypothetical protein
VWGTGRDAVCGAAGSLTRAAAFRFVEGAALAFAFAAVFAVARGTAFLCAAVGALRFFGMCCSFPCLLV